jgi:hypothetical protein
MPDQPIELILPPRRFMVLRWPTGSVTVTEVEHPDASPVPPKEEQ